MKNLKNLKSFKIFETSQDKLGIIMKIKLKIWYPELEVNTSQTRLTTQ